MTSRVSRYQKGKNQKGKTNLDLLEQEIVSGSGICWAICKSAPDPRQPRQHPTTQFFLQDGCPSCRPTNSVKALKSLQYLFRDGSEPFAWMLSADVKDVNLRLKARSNELVYLDVLTIKLQTTNLQQNNKLQQCQQCKTELQFCITGHKEGHFGKALNSQTLDRC